MYETTGTQLILKYKIRCGFKHTLRDFLCPNTLKFDNYYYKYTTEYRIEDQLIKTGQAGAAIEFDAQDDESDNLSNNSKTDRLRYNPVLNKYYDPKTM